jgi:hypothetical protein
MRWANARRRGSMPYDGFTDGQCPQCWLDGRWVDLYLNENDFWECPECKLQLKKYADGYLVMPFRGRGKLKEGAARLSARNFISVGSPLYGVRGYGLNSEFFLFRDEREFRAYVQAIRGD